MISFIYYYSIVNIKSKVYVYRLKMYIYKNRKILLKKDKTFFCIVKKKKKIKEIKEIIIEL